MSSICLLPTEVGIHRATNPIPAKEEVGTLILVYEVRAARQRWTFNSSVDSTHLQRVILFGKDKPEAIRDRVFVQGHWILSFRFPALRRIQGLTI
jgi:hypothetical protein